MAGAAGAGSALAAGAGGSEQATPSIASSAAPIPVNFFMGNSLVNFPKQ
jgi:hypothetical protein